MISHPAASALCREAAARARRLAEASVPGPWAVYDDEDSWCLHHADLPFQILKPPKRDTPFAEYWPDAGTGEHIAAWSPVPALAVADVFDAAAAELDVLAAADPDAPLPTLLSLTARAAETFLAGAS